MRFYWSIISKNNIRTHKNSKFRHLLMKLSQSNFNLQLPDCYLVRSYLIATVICFWEWLVFRSPARAGYNASSTVIAKNEDKYVCTWYILLYFFTAYAAEQLMLILKSPTRNTTMLSNNGKQSNCLSSFKTFVQTNWKRLFRYSKMAAFGNFCAKSICDKSQF